MYNEGMNFDIISKSRNLKQITIESHVITMFTKNPLLIDEKRVGITPKLKKRISDAIFQVGKGKLRPIKDVLDTDGGGNVSYFQIKTCLILL